MPSKDIFISHAEANKKLADKLVDLIETGIGIQDSKIFCASLEGLGIPSGSNFVDFIKKQISKPKIVILLLTPEYFKSTFCLCELGASWVLSHNIVPLILSPIKYSDIKAVLTGVQVLKIDQKSDLNEMQDQLISTFGIKGKPVARWEVKRDKFLKELSKYIEEHTPLKNISQEDFDNIEKKYKEAVEEMKSMDEQLDQKDELIEKLKQAKDSDEVKEIINNSMDSIKKFETFVAEAKEALSPLPYIVCDALYYYFRDEFLQWPKFRGDSKNEDIREAIENDYLIDNGGEIGLVEDDPEISDAIDSLRNLSDFVLQTEETEESGDGEGFSQYYKETYGHRFNFSSKRFWNEHLL